LSAIGGGLLAQWAVARIGGKKLPKGVSWLVGLGVATVLIYPLFF
jgi:hypothetical protein